jgi:Reverse transcriptase (RNA-dependent DNA polymerase)/Endonuclease-reverse transcriptase
LNNKISELDITLKDLDIDILVGTETWLKDSTPSAFITSDYNLFRRDRKGKKRGGGLIIGTKISMKALNCPRYESKQLEDAFVEIKFDSHKILIGAYYIPPGLEIDWRLEIKNALDKIIHSRSNYLSIIIFGDFNSKSFADPENTLITGVFAEYGFKQLVKEPTYKGLQNDSNLDLMFTNNLNLIKSVKVTENISPACDHHAIFSELTIPKLKVIEKRTIVTEYSNEAIKVFDTQIRAIDWFQTLNSINIDNNYERTCDLLSNFCAIFPTKIVVSKGNKLPHEIKALINQKRSSLSKYKQFKLESYLTDYNNLFKAIGVKITEINSQQITNLIKKGDNFKSFYSKLKKYFRPQTASAFIDSENKTHCNDKDIANAFKHHFEAIYNGQNNTLPTPPTLDFTFPRYVTCSIKFEVADIISEINLLKQSKSSGNSPLETKLLKLSNESLSLMLYVLYSKIILHTNIPQAMKLSFITPVPKANKPVNSITSYRGISICSNITKIFEKLILKNITAHIDLNKSIPGNQYGFRAKCRIEYQIIDMLNIVYKGFDSEDTLCTDLIFIDLSNAFDTIPHALLLLKLERIGIKGNLLDLIRESLTNRKQQVKFNGEYSETFSALKGTPQGSVLSPTLFNIYLSDFPVSALNSHSFLYCDDIVLVKTIKSESCCNKLQSDLITLENYFKNNGLLSNTKKTIHMRVSLKKQSNAFIYTLNSEQIFESNEHKHLGIVLDSHLRFNSFCDMISTKALQKWAMIRGTCKLVNGETLLLLYNTYILPLIEYASISWLPNRSQSKTLETIQRKITKTITYKLGFQDLSYNERLTKLKIKPISVRRQFKILKLIHKCKITPSEVPLNWTEIFKFTERHRSGTQIVPIFARTAASDKNFFVYASKMYNMLPTNVRNEGSMNVFCQKLNLHLNSTYDVSGDS